MDPATRAALAVARGRVNRIKGQVRELARELAALDHDDVTVVSTTRVHDAASTDAALERIAFGRARYGAVDVIVVAAPGRRAHPPKPDQG